MQALLILNHAPDYREEFLRQLGDQVDLTVVAQPCEPDKLTPPDTRGNYHYVEIKPRTFLFFRRQPELHHLVKSKPWDVICASANPRHISRIRSFLASKERRRRWIWWGLIFGEHDHALLHFLRRHLLGAAAGVLVHSEQVRARLTADYQIPSVSYNNTSVRKGDFRPPVQPEDDGRIHVLFVGTYKPRKQIERLIHIAKIADDVDVRIIGPGMEGLSVPEILKRNGRVTILPRAVGDELNGHFDWAHLAVSPGNTGLLVIEAARHGKPIAVDNESYHGPEVWAARATDQPFLPFGDDTAVLAFLQSIRQDRSALIRWGTALQNEGIQNYTIEHMVSIHIAEFRRVMDSSRSQ